VSTAEPVVVSDLARVERELLRMRSGDGGSSVRATTLNLVAVAAEPEQLTRTMDALQLIGGSRPLRAIVNVPGDGPTTAEVSSSAWHNPSGHEVRSEQIIVRGQAKALPSAVASLVVPDLPVFLLWNGSLGDQRELFERLASDATRLILDSDECGLREMAQAATLGAPVTDLAWARLTPWREAVASLTDSSDGLAMLNRSMGVEVRGPDNEAALIAGWLRSRLGRQLGFQHEPQNRGVSLVRIDCGKADLVVERTGHGDVGRARGGDDPGHTVMLPCPDWAALLASQLDRLGRDPVFDDALAAAGK
jgi:glucose-6-phosphate dehydrogenase assembly protein OpcA